MPSSKIFRSRWAALLWADPELPGVGEELRAPDAHRHGVVHEGGILGGHHQVTGPHKH
eukprot:gene29-54_t